MHADLPRHIESTIRGKSRPTVSAELPVQSELELVVAGVAGFAAAVVEESLDFDAPVEDDESDEDEEDGVDSVDDVDADDDFDFPPRLSVL